MKKPILIIAGVGVASALAWYLYNRSKQTASAQPVQSAQPIMAQPFSAVKTLLPVQTPTLITPTEAAKYIQPVKVQTVVQTTQPQKVDVPVITTMPREAMQYIQPVATVAQPIYKSQFVSQVSPVKTSGGSLVYEKDISNFVQEYPQYSRDHTVAIEGLGEPRLR